MSLQQERDQIIVVLANPLTGCPLWTTDEQTPRVSPQNPIPQITIERHNHQSSVESVFHQVFVNGISQTNRAREHGPMASPVEQGTHPIVHVLVDEEP